MLVRPPSPRKDSLRNRSNGRSRGGLAAKPLELRIRQSVEEGRGHGGRQRRVAQERIPDAGAQLPSGMRRDDLQGARRRPKVHRRLHDVRLRGEPVVQEGGDHTGVRIEPEDEEGPTAGGPGEVGPLGHRQFGKPAEQLRVGGPPDVRMDPGLRREVRQVTPEERFDESQGLAPRRVPMARERQANRVEPTRLRVSQDLLELRLRKVRALQPSE